MVEDLSIELSLEIFPNRVEKISKALGGNGFDRNGDNNFDWIVGPLNSSSQ